VIVARRHRRLNNQLSPLGDQLVGIIVAHFFIAASTNSFFFNSSW
jgi:hypothetical protein